MPLSIYYTAEMYLLILLISFYFLAPPVDVEKLGNVRERDPSEAIGEVIYTVVLQWNHYRARNVDEAPSAFEFDCGEAFGEGPCKVVYHWNHFLSRLVDVAILACQHIAESDCGEAVVEAPYLVVFHWNHFFARLVNIAILVVESDSSEALAEVSYMVVLLTPIFGRAMLQGCRLRLRLCPFVYSSS